MYKKNWSKNHTHIWLLLLILLILELSFIWVHSIIPAAESGRESGWVMALLTPVLEIFVGKGNVTNHFVRKIAHFSEFCALGMTIGGRLLVKQKTSLFHWYHGLLSILAAAVVDETIQLFAKGRTGQVQDILLDTAGGLTGLLVLFVISTIVKCVWKNPNVHSSKRKAKDKN